MAGGYGSTAPAEMGSPSDLNLDAAQSGGQNLGQPHRSSECPEWQVWVISGSADHVDGLPRARPVYLSKRTRFAPAAEGSALGQKRLRVLPMARKRNGGRSAIP